ncbi:hypothetical protein BO91_01210 [Candidatus Synechococcus spongiarum LMB bulk10E]|uniref:DUF3146 domain-containing protein n=3 Tax=Candidatus Synechococcus spongiarum TaxID=431041 RepID=A0A1T1CRP5_9SYNE|nr:DUF3146 family protein [Candidatus Synechococcus spongiarum]KKZ14252.1 MAG: hypothetical protein TQ37_01610 [Candidatus Synechococcus spongiarum 15L]MCY4360018.1 DUF3146 family protein [Cyanobacteria bacterium MAG APA_bin_95]OOV31230.1 hypothetical protein BV61_04895 [Candidatus Synechococcus spongiarum LMB bulk15M]OOV34716.1 hypothetical protein BO91_01210 [Candidatus Synechococcus spongiarum LMB bulk10E]OOV36497.1 hypothetical protein BV53_00510 [Candidatus Synechococcus spongiarum LMB bu
MVKLPVTTAQLQVFNQDLHLGLYHGQVRAGEFAWVFRWHFRQGKLQVEPSLGRALIEDALLRFLLRCDYQLEVGGEYNFLVRATV